MKVLLFCFVWILIKLSAAQIDDVTEPNDFMDGEACVNGVQATANSATGATVTWNQPDGSCYADTYQITATASNLRQCGEQGDSTTGSWITDVTSALSGLSSYTSYTIIVTPGSTDSMTGVITPGMTTSVQVTTNPLAPEAITNGPTISSTTDRSTELDVSWTYSPSHMQCDIFVVRYELTNQDQCQQQSGGNLMTHTANLAQSSTTITDLLPYSTYRVYVNAMNDEGDGAASSALGTTPDAAPSAAPSNPQVGSITSSSITFNWDNVPCGSRRGAITGYRYSIVPAGQAFNGDTDTNSNDRSVTVGDLACNTAYNFRVAAITSGGVGPYSSTITATSGYSSAAIMANTNLAVPMDQVTESTAQINWQAPACVSPNAQYSVQYQLTNLEQCQQTTGPLQSLGVITGGQTTATIGNLAAYSTYTVTVTGTGPSGQSASVSESFTTSQGKPPVSPPGLSLTGTTPTSISFSWSAIACGSRAGIISYQYEVRQGVTFVTGGETQTSLSATVNGLRPFTTYFVTVAARTLPGLTGPSSTALSAMTAQSAATNPVQNPNTGAACTSCFSTRYITLTVVFVRTAVSTPAVFTPALNNPFSQEYQVLVIRVTIVFQVYCDRFVGCIGVRVLGFFPGSIGVNADFIMEEDSPVTGAMVMETILDEASENENDIGTDLFITPAATRVDDLCPPNYCQNGGTCYSDTETHTGFCICAEGFGGTTCTDTVTGGGAGGGVGTGDVARTRAITIAFTTIGLVLIIALIATGFAIYVRILRPRIERKRQMDLRGNTPYPETILGQDSLLVDSVTLASPWSFRQSLLGGEAFVGPRV